MTTVEEGAGAAEPEGELGEGDWEPVLDGLGEAPLLEAVGELLMGPGEGEGEGEGGGEGELLFVGLEGAFVGLEGALVGPEGEGEGVLSAGLEDGADGLGAGELADWDGTAEIGIAWMGSST